MNLGAGICFIDSPDREQLTNLRFKLLDGKIPESLRTEEEMWQRMNSMSDADRSAAFATLAMKSLGELDRQFDEMHPDPGPVPEELQPAFDNVQRRIQEIERTAAAMSVDPELAELMKRYVKDAASEASSTMNDAESGKGHRRR